MFLETLLPICSLQTMLDIRIPSGGLVCKAEETPKELYKRRIRRIYPYTPGFFSNEKAVLVVVLEPEGEGNL